jgi:hypothetical protein
MVERDPPQARRGVAVNRRARTLIRAGGGRMAIDPGRVLLLRPFGDRHVIEYDRAAVRRVEHMFTSTTPATTWTSCWRSLRPCRV